MRPECRMKFRQNFYSPNSITTLSFFITPFSSPPQARSLKPLGDEVQAIGQFLNGVSERTWGRGDFFFRFLTRDGDGNEVVD